MVLASFLAAVRSNPVAAALELGSLVLSFLLLLGVVAALATGSPGRPGGLWLVVVAVGAAFACFWTVGWPLLERLRERIAA
ncbi:hypothetical protein C479_08848 [Halovivax asiaticus JCM 14624]|uniref:Uncharacterized protein n=1 Tax=Halovivax asiaticus JCM 14624 TaxID=1227490 RepID=M0BKA6_9EURY|nr:hypothetical protein [Halovivax asiaticus]ELZ10907.1 hypothetical protein C479_08848 [Halovivax asiaticus JCM 14624]